jgi:probable F420-dependent oxidoreductase
VPPGRRRYGGTVFRPFRFGLQTSAFGDHDALVAAARQAEALGYAELLSFDHIGEVDPLVPLVVAAEATTTLRIGPLVLNNEFHHPAMIARTAATVDRLSGGRLLLGLGTGYMQSEHDAIGMMLRPPAERVSRFDESVQVLRALLDDGKASFSGTHHSVAIDDLGVRPVQARVPFLIGGHGRRVVGIAARHADIFQFTGLTHGEGGRPGPGGFPIDTILERHRWLLEAAGDRADSIERSALVQVTHIGDGADERAADVAARFSIERVEIDRTPFVLIGSVNEVVDKLERLRELIDLSHVVVRDAEGFAPVVDALAGR